MHIAYRLEEVKISRTYVPDFKKDDLMETHDQETGEYFRNANVHCILCPHNPSHGRSIIQGFEISTMFTNHQKTTIFTVELLVLDNGIREQSQVLLVGLICVMEDMIPWNILCFQLCTL
jgi:phospholipase D1/2